MEQSRIKISTLEQYNQQTRRKMNSYKSTYELVDISSDEEENLERASTPLPRCEIPNYRVILEVPRSPAEATVDEEEYFDLSLDSLESDCKRLKLNISYESINSAASPDQDLALENLRIDGPADSPESPDQSLNSDVFLVEQTSGNESPTSSRILEYLEQVRQDDADSFFSTPPGPLRRIDTRPISPLNDLEEMLNGPSAAVQVPELPQAIFAPRQPGLGAFPRGVALSQPAPGLACGCRRVGIGRGHGCSLRFPKWYFNY